MNHALEFHSGSGNLQQQPGPLSQRPRLLIICLVALFLIAGLVRLYHVDAPGVLIDREFVSAVIARDFYYKQAHPVANWLEEVAATTAKRQPVLEPPATEYLVSLIYRATGGERLWVSHVLTSLFWLVGGFFFFRVARVLLSTEAAVIAVAYYLLSPLSILVSRSFQPDSLMMLLFMISLYSIVVHFQHPTEKRALIVGGITGLAFLYRPLVLFPLLGAFIALAVYQRRTWRGVMAPSSLILGGTSLLLPVAYYGYGIVIAGFLRWKVDTSFLPALYLQREYWEGWLTLANNGIGPVVLIGALLGIPTMGRGMPRAVLVGLGAGYLAFGLVFTAHIYTHHYYQAQLIPIVALPFGSLAAHYVFYLKKRDIGLLWWLPIVAAVLIVLYFDVRVVREQVGSQRFESEQVAREIGELVNHSTETVFVARFYGMPLQYYGGFSGTRWPKPDEPVLYEKAPDREQTIEERLKKLGYEPDYFIITDLTQLNTYHTDLKEYLQEYCSVRFQTEKYLIYDGQCAAPGSPSGDAY